MKKKPIDFRDSAVIEAIKYTEEINNALNKIYTYNPGIYIRWGIHEDEPKIEYDSSEIKVTVYIHRNSANKVFITLNNGISVLKKEFTPDSELTVENQIMELMAIQFPKGIGGHND